MAAIDLLHDSYGISPTRLQKVGQFAAKTALDPKVDMAFRLQAARVITTMVGQCLRAQPLEIEHAPTVPEVESDPLEGLRIVG